MASGSRLLPRHWLAVAAIAAAVVVLYDKGGLKNKLDLSHG